MLELFENGCYLLWIYGLTTMVSMSLAMGIVCLFLFWEKRNQ